MEAKRSASHVAASIAMIVTAVALLIPGRLPPTPHVSDAVADPPATCYTKPTVQC
jgi:hypothetical protein